MTAEEFDKACTKAGPDGAVVLFAGRFWTFADMFDALDLLEVELPADPELN